MVILPIKSMFTWIASFPKSGNTMLRLLLADYFYQKDNSEKNFSLLNKIPQYPNISFFENIDNNKNLKFYDINFCKNFWHNHQDILSQQGHLFIKTHNCQFFNNYSFTSNKVTKSIIYIIRDPRNVLLSLKDYLMIDEESALEYLTGDIFKSDTQKNKKIQHTYIGNWETNFLSWNKNSFFFPIKFIKYEDLVNNTKEEFLNILMFLKNFSSFDIDPIKISNIVKNNSFSKLVDMESKFGFPESNYENKNKFFIKGEKRNFQNEISDFSKKKIESLFVNTMKKFQYI